MSSAPPPRLYCIVAREAPVAVVFCRGPSKWWHIMKWDLTNDAVEHGAWIKAKLTPEYCSLSPNGRLLCYFVRRYWKKQYCTCFAVSKLPWLTALCAWETPGDPHGGCWFYRNDKIALSRVMTKKPFQGEFRGSVVQRLSGVTKRDHGWKKPSTGIRIADKIIARSADIYGTGRAQVVKQSSTGHGLLRRDTADIYALESDNGVAHTLYGVSWADWDHDGRLLVATDDGFLQVCDPRQGPEAVTWQHDLRDLRPDPQPAPEWAREW